MQFEIRHSDGLLLADGRPVEYVPSPNTSGARIEPALIVLHNTADWTRYSDDAVSWFKNPAAKVSAHLVIDRAGKITQCVPFDRVAWHAGPSSWRGRQQCNGWSIGIEIDNPGGLTGTREKARAAFGEIFGPEAGVVEIASPKHWSKLWLPETEAQLAAVEGIIRALAQAYPTILEVVGHHDISPGRKEDPTPCLPWERMRAALGPRPAPIDADLVAEAQAELARLGYNPGAADGLIGQRTRAALFAFQQQNGLAATGTLDKATFDRLRASADAVTPAKEMPLGNRAEMTEVKGSRTVAAGTAVKAGALVAAAAEAGGGLVDSGAVVTDAIDQASQAVGTAEKGVGLIDRAAALVPKVEKLWAWLGTPPGLKTLAALALILLLWRLGGLIKRWRLEDARSGSNAK